MDKKLYLFTGVSRRYHQTYIEAGSYDEAYKKAKDLSYLQWDEDIDSNNDYGFEVDITSVTELDPKEE